MKGPKRTTPIKAPSLANATSSIRLSVRTKKMLNELKKGNETDDDVVRKLITKDERITSDSIIATKYRRKTSFKEIGNIGIEFEYNDIIGNEDYTFDIKIKKIYTENDILNPSVFFNKNPEYLEIYLMCVLDVLSKERKVKVTHMYQHEKKLNTTPIKSIVKTAITKNLILWKKLYVDYNLSEESFNEDVARILKKAKEFSEKR